MVDWIIHWLLQLSLITLPIINSLTSQKKKFADLSPHCLQAQQTMTIESFTFFVRLMVSWWFHDEYSRLSNEGWRAFRHIHSVFQLFANRFDIIFGNAFVSIIFNYFELLIFQNIIIHYSNLIDFVWYSIWSHSIDGYSFTMMINFLVRDVKLAQQNICCFIFYHQFVCTMHRYCDIDCGHFGGYDSDLIAFFHISRRTAIVPFIENGYDTIWIILIEINNKILSFDKYGLWNGYGADNYYVMDYIGYKICYFCWLSFL